MSPNDPNAVCLSMIPIRKRSVEQLCDADASRQRVVCAPPRRQCTSNSARRSRQASSSDASNSKSEPGS
eukprot:3813739-Rhodomonas_salina.2